MAIELLPKYEVLIEIADRAKWRVADAPQLPLGFRGK